MSERRIDIDGEVWEYAIGRHGLGIRNPRDGKRHNIRLNEFFLTVTSGPTYLSEHNVRPITPVMIREFVEVKFLETRQLPEFRMDYHSGTCHVFAHKSIPHEEVLRRVQEESFWHTTPMEDGDVRMWNGENPIPARHAPTTHLMYFFEYVYELSDAYKKKLAADIAARQVKNYEPAVTSNDKVIYVKKENV